MATKYRLNVRRFLNRKGHHAGAYIIAQVEDTSARTGTTGDPDDYHWGDYYLSIADCSRQITLDFDLDTKADRRNALHKINRLVEDLTAFRDALQEEVNFLNTRPSKNRGR